MKKTQKITQLGRSMMEMLGVLAIIGVLSVCSVHAFRMAMNRMKINAFKSWLNAMEFAFHENCFFTENANCLGGTGRDYARRRQILCNALGDNYCASVSGAYATLKFIPNIQWTADVTADTWGISLRNLTEQQCEQFFSMDLPQYVYRINTNNSSVSFTNRAPILTTAERNRLILACQNAAKTNTAWGGIFTLNFNRQ